MKPFQPRLKFWLIDEGAYGAAALEAMQRVTAAIFRFEHTPDIESAKQAILHLAKMVAQSPYKQRIDRAVMQWMKYRLSHKLPGVAVPDVEQLLEGTDMLETNIDRWKAQAIAEGIQSGRLLGEREGELRAKKSLLLRTLSRRFKQVPDSIRQRIEQAPTEHIDDWFDRAVDAPSLEEVFGADDARH